MAYNNGYPINYPYFSPQGQNQQIMQQPIQQPIQQPMQAQNSGFVSVPNEEVARNYPVAPGNSVTFKNENAPYVYTKTMGFSQLDRPIFEKYKLVREDDVPPQNQNDKSNFIDMKAIDNINSEIKKIWSDINVLKEQAEKTADFIKRMEDMGA